MQHTPPGARDLLTPEELRAVTRKIADQTNRAFTWHNLSLFAAKVTLLIFFMIWLGTFWWMVEPGFQLFQDVKLTVAPQQLFYGFISATITIGMAFACTVVPPIFWSSLIAQTPAAELMNRLYAKYGKTGFYIAMIGAIVFTVMGFNVFKMFWLAKPNVTNQGMLEVYWWALISTFLAVVFPAWALNKTTPEQWIAGMVQAREVARLQHALALEEMVGAAMIARADALLHADLLSMTTEERALNNRELAALIATTERRINKAFGRISHTFYSLHGMALNVQTDQDDRIVSGYQRLAALLFDTDEQTDKEAAYYEKYVKTLPDVAPALPAPTPRSAMPLPRVADGPTVPTADQRSAPRAAAPHVAVKDGSVADTLPRQTVSDQVRQGLPNGMADTLPPPQYQDAWLACRAQLTTPFRVATLAEVAKVSPRTADRIRKVWIESGHLAATDRDGFYFWTDTNWPDDAS
jgi:hypothetical protein